jgi:hypothetical protein
VDGNKATRMGKIHHWKHMRRFSGMSEATIQTIVNTTRRGCSTQFVDLRGPTSWWGAVGGVDLDRMPKLNTSILMGRADIVLLKRS